MNDKKIIHIVGGGEGQLPLVQKANEMGMSVLVTDMYADSPCRKYADIYCVADTTDRQGVLAIAGKYEVDAIATDQTDVAVPTVAYVAEQLGLPGVTLDVANKFTNKLLMREIAEVEIPENIPRFKCFDNVSEAIKYAEACKTPFILKPVNSQGSKGVFKCESFDEQKVRASFDESRGSGILVEEFISGIEVSLECVTVEGKTQILAFSKKTQFPNNPCIDKCITYFDDLDEEIKRRVYDVSRRFIEATGLTDGLTHAEFKVQEGKPFLLEIACRGGGSGISGVLIPGITDFDVNEFVLDCAMGKPLGRYQTKRQRKFALLEFMEFPPGKVKTVAVNRNLEKYADHFSLHVEPGDVVPEVNDSRDRSGSFIVIGQSIDEVIKKADAIRASVDIIYE